MALEKNFWIMQVGSGFQGRISLRLEVRAAISGRVGRYSKEKNPGEYTKGSNIPDGMEL